MVTQEQDFGSRSKEVPSKSVSNCIRVPTDSELKVVNLDIFTHPYLFSDHINCVLDCKISPITDPEIHCRIEKREFQDSESSAIN